VERKFQDIQDGITWTRWFGYAVNSMDYKIGYGTLRAYLIRIGTGFERMMRWFWNSFAKYISLDHMSSPVVHCITCGNPTRCFPSCTSDRCNFDHSQGQRLVQGWTCPKPQVAPIFARNVCARANWPCFDSRSLEIYQIYCYIVELYKECFWDVQLFGFRGF